MRLSYVIVTRNRAERLMDTIRRLIRNTPLPVEAWEVIVVDNGSDDGTVPSLRKLFPWVHLIALPENEGMPARNHAFARARGRYLVLLDDDSYPTPHAISSGLNYLSHRPSVAALVARVLLPSGQCEAPALPAVLLGGATILRRSVIETVGGFAPEFFRQAEEYDLSFRIWEAGFTIERFEDLLFHHDKAPGGRSSAFTHKMDLRNNLILVERYLPRELRTEYRRDWIRRYAALARGAGHEDSVDTALREARIWARREAAVGRKTLSPRTIEQLFNLEQQAKQVADWAREHGIRRVIVGDFSKNFFATWRACRLAGLAVTAIADDRPEFAGSPHRQTPIVPITAIAGSGVDGVVLSNVNPIQIDARFEALRAAYRGPILRLWEPKFLRQTTKPSTNAA